MIGSQRDTAILVLRTALGAVLLAHALAKPLIFTMPGTAQFFEAVGFPGALAYPVALVELVSGLLLIAGWHTRWAALAVVPVMLGAVKAHVANGWLFTAPNGGWEFPAFLLAVAAALFLLGEDGALAVGGGRTASP